MNDANKIGADLMDLNVQDAGMTGMNIELEAVKDVASDRGSTKGAKNILNSSTDESGELLIQKSDWSSELHQDYEKPMFGTEVPVRQSVVEKPVYYGLFGCTFSIVLTAVGPGLISIPYAANVLNSFQMTLALNAFCVCVMASGAECLIRVRKNVHTIFLRNRHAQLSQLVTTER